jgi:putative membrane protein insertion efficiency factor
VSVRALLWQAGAPIRAVLIVFVRLYRAALSGVFGGQCRFYPSCSHFAEDAIRAHGAIRGTGLIAWRVLRCNPFGRGGIDRVPPRWALHDAVIQYSVRRTDHEMTGA